MVAYLRIPAISEEEEVGTVKEDVERWQTTLSGRLRVSRQRFAHQDVLG